jgi:translation initiation factor 1
VCESVAKDNQNIVIKEQKRSFGKDVTVISGISPKEIDLRLLSKDLKTSLACGGTVKNSAIELQGKHKHKAMDLLVKNGFSQERIKML